MANLNKILKKHSLGKYFPIFCYCYLFLPKYGIIVDKYDNFVLQDSSYQKFLIDFVAIFKWAFLIKLLDQKCVHTLVVIEAVGEVTYWLLSQRLLQIYFPGTSQYGPRMETLLDL